MSIASQPSRSGRTAQSRRLLACHDLRRHQPDVIHVGCLADIDGIGNIGEVHIVVTLDEHHAFRAVGINLGQTRKQIGLRHVGFVDLVIRSRAGAAPNYKINETDVAKADLLPRLTEIYANRAERVMFIKGDDNVNFSYIADAIDIGKAANVDHIGLMTPKIMAGQ